MYTVEDFNAPFPLTNEIVGISKFLGYPMQSPIVYITCLVQVYFYLRFG